MPSADEAATRATGSDRGFATFTLIWLGQVVSTLGSGMTAFALGVEIFQNTGSVTRYALIALAVGLPNLIFGPIVGVLADRYDRRAILLLANVGSALATLALVWLIQTGRTEQWQVYVAIAIGASFMAFIFPTFAAATTLLVDKRHFGRASGMNQMGNAVAQIAAPLAGGFLVGPIGLSGVIGINVATFVFAFATLLFVKLATPPRSADGGDEDAPLMRQMATGWRFIRARGGLLGLLGLFAALNFGVGMVQVLITPMVLAFATPVTLGIVLSIASSGMLVGGIVMSVWGGSARRMPTILYTALGQGLLLLASGLQPSATLITSVAFFFLLLFPILIGASQALWLAKVPPDLQGRVFATRRMIAFSTLPLAQILAGPLADGVFEPLMAPGGALAGSVGQVIGVGPGRGIALLLMLLGVLITLIALIGMRTPALRDLEDNVPDAVESELSDTADANRATPAAVTLPMAARGALAAVMLAVGAASLLSLAPPSPRGLDAPDSQVSAARAMRDVETLAAAPRPIGSPAHASARAYLVERLRALGLEVEVQEATSVADGIATDDWRLVQVAKVRNVVARRRAGGDAAPGGAVLLVAHYDTVPESPGASDNAAAIAAVLEAMRALDAESAAASPTDRNAVDRDVIVLFSDAEETGLHGARAFLAHHRWSDDVGMVINFDARGHGGPVYMFQTGESSGAAVRALAASGTRAFANSLMGEIYRHLPNDTDFSVFLEAGDAGLNLAFIDGLTHYHSVRDRPEDLDLASLQHHGELARGLVDALDAIVLDRASRDRAYFNVGGTLVHYPRWFAIATGFGGVLLLAWILLRAIRTGRLKVFELWQGFLAIFGQWVAVPIAATLVWFVVRDVAGVPVHLGGTDGAGRFMLAFAAVAVAAFFGTLAFWRRIVSTLHLTAGALMWWALLVLLTTEFWLPATSNGLFVWPLLGATLGFAWALDPTRVADSPWRTFAVLTLAALPALLIFMPFIATAYIGLQGLMQLGGVALALVVLITGLLLLQFEALSPRTPARLGMVAAVAAVALLAWALRQTQGMPSSSVIHVWNDESRQGRFVSFDQQTRPWTREIGLVDGVRSTIDDIFPLIRRPLLSAPAPSRPPSPAADWRVEISTTPVGDGEVEAVVRLHNPPRGRVRALWFEPARTVTEVALDGETIDLASGDDAGTKRPILQQLPLDGALTEVVVRFRPDRPLALHSVVQIDGLPRDDGLPPRPADLLPQPLFTLVRTDVSLIKQRQRIEASP